MTTAMNCLTARLRKSFRLRPAIKTFSSSMEAVEQTATQLEQFHQHCSLAKKIRDFLNKFGIVTLNKASIIKHAGVVQIEQPLENGFESGIISAAPSNIISPLQRLLIGLIIEFGYEVLEVLLWSLHPIEIVSVKAVIALDEKQADLQDEKMVQECQMELSQLRSMRCVGSDSRVLQSSPKVINTITSSKPRCRDEA